MRDRKFVFVVVLALTMGLLFSGIALGATGNKTLQAVYKNIKILVDGKAVTGSEEPFIVGDRVYVPLRMIGEVLDASVNWDAAKNSVEISGGGADTSMVAALQLQLLAKQKEVTELKAELEEMKKSPVVNQGDLKDLRWDLIYDYEKLKNIYFDDFTLSSDRDKVNVDIDVDLYDYKSDWKKLRDNDIKDWVTDIVKDIQKALGKDCYVDGRVDDIDSGDTLVTFSKDGSSSLKITYKDRKYRSSGGYGYTEDVEDDLYGDTFWVDNMRFEITYVKYSSSDVINVNLEAVSGTKSDWQDISTSKKNTDIRYICDEIAYTFEKNADCDPYEVRITLFDQDRYNLGTYLYDVYRDRLTEY